MSSNEKGKTKSEKRFLAPVVAALLVFAGGALQPASRAQAPAERWVGSWSTALVGRPQTPPLPGPPAPAPFMRQRMSGPCPRRQLRRSRLRAGVTFAPPPFLHFNNQTLRQIVRTSIGGNRAADRAEQHLRDRAAHDRAAHVALRDKGIAAHSGGRIRSRPLTFSGRPHPSRFRRAPWSTAIRWLSTIPALADLAVDHIPAGNHQHAVAGDDAHEGARGKRELRVADRQSRRHPCPVAGGGDPLAAWFLLTRVEVDGARTGRRRSSPLAISITDGAGSSAGHEQALAGSSSPRRLMAQPGTAREDGRA